MKEKLKKIHFHIPKNRQEDVGMSVESLWAMPSKDGLFYIDNLPMFLQDISYRDLISVKEEDSILFFDKIKEQSSNSILRIYMEEMDMLNELITFLKKQGCKTETSHIDELFAVSIPSTSSIDKIKNYLQDGEDKEYWEYEEASIRHDN